MYLLQKIAVWGFSPGGDFRFTFFSNRAHLAQLGRPTHVVCSPLSKLVCRFHIFSFQAQNVLYFRSRRAVLKLQANPLPDNLFG